jgi:hypothetical protein
MPDLVKAFCDWVDQKGLLYVAGRLGHDSTRFVERWRKEEKLPGDKQMTIFKAMQDEGIV